jgi:AsmA-like protein
MNLGKLIKRFFIVIGIIIGLFLITAILVPIFFKDKIMALVKKEMNEQLIATTDFKDVDISLFHSFPHLSVSITGLSIVGKDSFKSDTLIAAKSIDIALDLMKAINGTYDILNIGLVSPRIHAIVHTDGAANWNITKPTPPTTTATPAKPFAMKLRKYSVDNAFIEYNDEQGKMHLTIENLNHSGSGDFTSDAFTLSTKTTADAITFIYGNVPYLHQVKTTIDLDLGIDNKTNKYTFNTEKIQLNGLRLSTKGFVQMPDTNNMVMDIQFSTPSNDFKDILSLVPGIYQSNFKDIKTTGKLALNGMVKGTYNKKQMPAYQLNLAIQDGSFQYPNLPQKVANIQVKLAVDNPDGVTDHTVVNLSTCHIEFGAQPFDFHMLLKMPLTDQWIDAGAKGSIDLTQMQKFVKLDASTKLAGVVTADVSVKGSMAAAQKKEFDKIDASGTIGIKDLSYVAKDYPDGVNLYSLVLTFNPKNVTVSNLKGQYLGTIFSGDGGINNFLGYYLHNESLSGTFNFSADKVDVNKFMGPPTPPGVAPAAKTTDPFLIPANLDVELHASVGTVKYDNIVLTSVSGGVVLRNETASLQNVSGKTLDGSLKMSGSYSTKNDKKHPDIAFDYGVDAVDVQKTFTAFNTVQKMMPAAKYISSGKMTSNLTMTGKLQPDMTPDMNSLNGKGDLMLLSCVLSNFPVTDQIADKLHLTQFKTITLKDTKIFFSFANGRVTVQPYKTNIGGIDAEIAGSHGFDNTIDYGVNLVVPTSLMGSQGGAMVNNLVSQAASKGIPVKVGDKVNLTLKITGTTTNPKIETNLKNVAGDAVAGIKAEVKAKVDSVKTVVKTAVKDTVKAIKTQAVNTAKDVLKNQLQGGNSGTPPPNPVKDAGDKVKGGLNDLFHKKK